MLNFIEVWYMGPTQAKYFTGAFLRSQNFGAQRSTYIWSFMLDFIEGRGANYIDKN